ncbi:MAG: bacteriohemerythrin [Lachnospiraceae bacterium]|nr:bacteriohemerythrin [Lachnospiraceae bacterium]
MLTFTSDCLTGISQIDEEHETLFSMIQALGTALNDQTFSTEQLMTLLEQLKAYAALHFSHEEAYMESIHDPELPRQKKEHAAFTQKLSSYSLSTTDANLFAIGKELFAFLSHWLFAHILGSDILIGKLSKKPETSAFTFDDKYLTGIEVIDNEHRQLFAIISEINDVLHAEHLHDKYDPIMVIIRKLRDYTIFHFQDEEAYMERIGYAGLPAQKLAHTGFIDKLNELNYEDIDDHQDAYLEEFLNYLLSWLINHILKMDKQIPSA